MPRYVSYLDDGAARCGGDAEELPDHAAARREAVRLALAFASTQPFLDGGGGAVVVTVQDEAGARVSTARLALGVDDA